MNDTISRAKRVLVVDDEASMRSLLSSILSKPAYEVTEAYSGDNALMIASDQSFDVAFVDFVMPGLDGVETVKRLHKIQPNLTVVLMSGYMYNDDELKKAGAQHLLRKPFAPSTVLTLIDNAPLAHR